MVNARAAATAIALLPLLGRGNTHQDGEYRASVAAGLEFLLNSAQRADVGASWAEQGATMYGHGLTSIVLCELYAMTGDRRLRDPAQSAISFIEAVQDPINGGWRYLPQQPGDTSVTGWQIQALSIAPLAKLTLNPNTVKGAVHYMSSATGDGGRSFGYTKPVLGGRADRSTSCSSIGLLSQQIFPGEDRVAGHEAGIKTLATDSYKDDDIYFNYYSTEVMRHHGGELWTAWNHEMRDFLVETQEQEDPGKGSWMLGSDRKISNDKGGRLFCTSLACLTLETYYRNPDMALAADN